MVDSSATQTVANSEETKNSVSHWIANLKAGDDEAAQELWTRYSTRLLEAARQRLGLGGKGIADEEDVALMVFTSLCRGAMAGRFEDVRNRDDLWWMLLAITKRKTVDHKRRETAQKRGGGNVVSETQRTKDAFESRSAWSFDSVVGQDPTPEYLAIFAEQYSLLIAQLRDERLRQIAIWRIEGFSVPEIAAQLDIAQRSVERKLQLIRFQWSRELGDDG